jgi:uncharacterized protein YdhG (YjbR/CyaY superfamily)
LGNSEKGDAQEPGCHPLKVTGSKRGCAEPLYDPELFFTITGASPMRTKQPAPKNIDEYITRYPSDVQAILGKIRTTIRVAAPEAVETINYQIPTFTLNGNLVHFAAYKNHIGFYPTPSGIEKFKNELDVYEGAKGSVKFPLDRPIPYDLIDRIVRFRVNENLGRAKAKGR